MVLRVVIVCLAILPSALLGQTAPGTIPAGTPLALTTDRNYPMKAGQTIRARLLYPIYADNRLVLAKDTVIEGSVIALQPDAARRLRARLGGDFTPFDTPEVRFTRVMLAGGVSVPIEYEVATKGAPIYRAVATPPAKGGFVGREVHGLLEAVRRDIAVFTAPGRGDRLLQFIYGEIPYHPQRIEKGTAWTVETGAPVEVPPQPAAEAVASPTGEHHLQEKNPAPEKAADTGAWIVQANLADPLSSETSKAGETVRAVVAEPIYNPDHTVAVPQGAILTGTVNRAKPARRFGRTGVLSFNFSQLVVPKRETQTVETRLTGADSTQDIALNSEGQAKSKPEDKLSIPLFLAALASRPLDRDCGHPGGCRANSARRDGTAGAAGLGLAGTIVSLAGGSPFVSAGIGYWGAARAVYNRWIARGQTISFAKDTRIVVQTTPRHSSPMKPNAPLTH